MSQSASALLSTLGLRSTILHSEQYGLAETFRS
jgi:hypothetical protein